jgi:hypothetical protein
MLIDIETSSRCALAALDVLSRELGHLPLPNDQARRVDVLLGMARQHVTELVTTAPTGSTAPPTSGSAPPVDNNDASSASDLSSEANIAWIASAALRQSTSAAEVQKCCQELSALAARTRHPRVRQLCHQALRTS